MRLIGVDEAGRGPVLGSMFAAAVGIPDPGVLPEGLDDSKNLAPERRERLAAELRDQTGVAVGIAEVRPARIDDPGTDMNTLAVRAQASAIDAAVDGGEVIADACDTDEARFAGRVREAVDCDVAVTAEHRADENHAIVAAASIVAKVERDAHVDTLAEEYGEVGSGYPSDPTTREFLEGYVAEHGEVPPCARSSWETCRQLLAEQEQSELNEI